jgi:hypothetical protein
MHTHSLDKLIEFIQTSARKLMASLFCDKKGVLMVEFMHQGTRITSDVHCEMLGKLHSDQKAQNADMHYTRSAPPWHNAYAYNCSHSSTAGAFHLGVVWPPSLQPWSRSKWLPPLHKNLFPQCKCLTFGSDCVGSSLSMYVFFVLLTPHWRLFSKYLSYIMYGTFVIWDQCWCCLLWCGVFRAECINISPMNLISNFCITRLSIYIVLVHI